MSLQVWLPLNGNLQNKGLSDISVTNNGATVDNGGKIGKCYSFNNNYIQTNYNFYPGVGDFSISCWFYLTENTGKSYQHICSFKTTAAASAGIAVIYNRRQQKFLWSTANGSTAQEIWSADIFPTSTIYNTWHHIIMVRDSKDIKHGYFYLDGIRRELASIPTILNITTNANTMKIGSCGQLSSSYYWTGKLNDFRIYNHALSIKEAKEISKALVLHYPLNDKYIESTTNLCNGLVAGGRTTVINNTIVNTGANADTYWYIKPKEALVGGATYTVSCYLSGFSSSSTYISWGVCAQSGANSAGSWKCYNGHNEFTFTMPSNLDGSTANIIFDDNGGTRTEIFTISQIQLEKKDHATGYAGIGGIRNSTIVYDCSGYQNNGTIINLFCSNDTIKNQSSTSFDGNTSVIQLGNISSLLQNTFTMNLWFKKSELGSKGYETLFGGPSGFEMDTRAGGSTTLSLYMTSTRRGNAFSPFNFNQWYMVTMVNDGTNELYYINGELKKTIVKKSMPSGNYFIGAWSSATAQNYKGLISDFRLYTTPLSEEDILQLYNTRAQADRNNNFYTEGNFIEEGYNNQIEYFYNFKKGSGSGILSHESDGLHLNGGIWVYHGSSEYISINPSGKTYKYDVVCSIDAGNQFYIGWERYDADKTARSNDACTYIVATKPTSNLVYKHYSGTVNLSTDGVNPCAFIRLRILNKWSGSTTDTNGTAIIHSLSLKEYSTSDVFTPVNISKTGLTKSTEILQINNIDKININRTQQINANNFIQE